MKQKATIKDVAKLAGVSFKTVSRVINKEPSVGKELKSKVWKAIEELNYHPNLSARQMRGGSAFIGFIYDNPNSHYIIEMQRGILDECRRQGYELVIHPCSASSPTIIEELLDVVNRNQIGGLILSPPLSESESLVRALSKQGVATVRILSASELQTEDPTCIYVNDYGAALHITQYLLELGHQDIAFLSGDKQHLSSIQRQAGYRDAYHEIGLEADPDLQLDGEFSFESGLQRAKLLLQSTKRPTAIFACNDEIAAGTLVAARLMGIEVPEDLSIIGFEDSPFSRQTWPKLSTARQPNNTIAQRATKLLIEQIKPSGNRLSDQERGFLPKLVIRDSTSAPSTAGQAQ